MAANHLDLLLRKKAHKLLETFNKISNPELSFHKKEVSVSDLTNIELTEDELEKILQFVEDCLIQIRLFVDADWSGKNIMEKPSYGPKYKGPFIQGSKVKLNHFFDYTPFLLALELEPSNNTQQEDDREILILDQRNGTIFLERDPKKKMPISKARLDIFIYLVNNGLTKTSDLVDLVAKEKGSAGAEDSPDYDVSKNMSELRLRFKNELDVPNIIISRQNFGYDINTDGFKVILQ